MAKIYSYYLSHADKTLNFADSLKENDIQQIINSLFEEDNNLSNEEEEDDDLPLLEDERETLPNKDEMLHIDEIIDLGPWVYIDNTTPLPIITRKNDSDDEEWNPEEILN